MTRPRCGEPQELVLWSLFLFSLYTRGCVCNPATCRRSEITLLWGLYKQRPGREGPVRARCDEHPGVNRGAVGTQLPSGLLKWTLWTVTSDQTFQRLQDHAVDVLTSW